jgi:hypothetical protein
MSFIDITNLNQILPEENIYVCLREPPILTVVIVNLGWGSKIMACPAGTTVARSYFLKAIIPASRLQEQSGLQGHLNIHSTCFILVFALPATLPSFFSL